MALGPFGTEAQAVVRNTVNSDEVIFRFICMILSSGYLLPRWWRWHNFLPSTGTFLDVRVIAFGLIAVIPVVG
jgi:endonuclease YncB( thermonuclease family)